MEKISDNSFLTLMENRLAFKGHKSMCTMNLILIRNQ